MVGGCHTIYHPVAIISTTITASIGQRLFPHGEARGEAPRKHGDVGSSAHGGGRGRGNCWFESRILAEVWRTNDNDAVTELVFIQKMAKRKPVHRLIFFDLAVSRVVYGCCILLANGGNWTEDSTQEKQENNKSKQKGHWCNQLISSDTYIHMKGLERNRTEVLTVIPKFWVAPNHPKETLFILKPMVTWGSPRPLPMAAEMDATALPSPRGCHTQSAAPRRVSTRPDTGQGGPQDLIQSCLENNG